MKQIWTNSGFNTDVVDSHEYDLTEKDDSIILLYSEKSGWTSPGEEAARIANTGDGYRINVGDDVIEIDYAEAFEILTLLIAMTKDRLEVREYTTTFVL